MELIGGQYIKIMAYVNNIKRGWDRLNPDSLGTISYDFATRTMSISPKTGQDEFYFWSNDRLFSKTSTQSVVFPDVSGTYYFYFDTDGILQYILDDDWTHDLFVKIAITGLVYYDAVAKSGWYASDEQHGVLMNSACHYRLHTVDNYKWSRIGGNIIGLTDASDTYTKIEWGIWEDEDISITIAETTEHPFIYRSGTNGEWKMTAADNKVGYVNSGDTYVCYNKYSGGTWQLIESNSSTDYIIYFFIATNFATHPIRKIIGQTTYSSRNAARKGLLNELKAIQTDGLPSAEMEFIYAYICKRNGDLEDDGYGNAYVDLRGVNINSLLDS